MHNPSNIMYENQNVPNVNPASNSTATNAEKVGTQAYNHSGDGNAIPAKKPAPGQQVVGELGSPSTQMVLVDAKEGRKADRIVVIGPTGSGKSCLYASILELSRSRKKDLIGYIDHIEVPHLYDKSSLSLPQGTQGNTVTIGDPIAHFRKLLQQRRGNKEDFTPLNGSYKKDGVLYDFDLIDTKGGLIAQKNPAKSDPVDKWPPIFQLTLNCDLLILVLPPEYFANLRNPAKKDKALEIKDIFGAHVRRMINQNPNGMVALVYSKCDEYGVHFQGPRRVIFDKKTAELYEKVRRDTKANNVVMADAWDLFNRDLRNQQAYMKNDPSTSLRHELIQETSDLWTQVLNSPNEININGYFVAANPAEKHQNIDLIQRGFAQVFIDFIHHKRTIQSRPRIHKSSLIVLAVISVLILLMVILFKLILN